MFTRRGFLVGLVASAGLTALKPSFAARLERHLDEIGGPLLEVPQRPKLVITAWREMETLHIGDPYEDYPRKTWRQYLLDQGMLPASARQWREISDLYWIEPSDLEKECPLWVGVWARTESSHALAYKYLDRLDLGPVVTTPNPDTGYLTFLDGPCIGSDYLGVQYSCDRALSFLQHRLNELGVGVAIEVM
jgi:hypothetical protein